LNWLLAEGSWQIQKLRLEGSHFKGRIYLGVIPSPFPENFTLELKYCLQFSLDVLEGVLEVLVLVGYQGIVFFHRLRHHLIILMLSVHHDESRSIGLQLLDHFKAVPHSSFVQPTADFVLETLDGLFLFATHVDILILSSLDPPVFFGPFLLFGAQSISVCE
jgi:hypothetical protein